MVVGVGVLGCDGADPATGPDEGAELPLRPRFPIDGVANLNALPIVFDADVPWRNGQPGSTPVRIAMLNDDRDLYLAVEWADPTYDDSSGTSVGFDGIRLLFDSNGDAVVGPGDDGRTVDSAYEGSLYMDRHVDPTVTDGMAKDRVGDGLGRLSYDASSGRYTVEFLLPFENDTRAEDVLLSASTRFAVSLYDASSNSVALPMSDISIGASTVEWPTLDLKATSPIERPAVPADLSGVVALLSEHEGPRRLYLYRPRSGDLRAVPVDPALHIERIALSNDLNWIALEASYTPDDRHTFEIFRVATDGGRLERLTDNAFFDGGPSWSRSDHRIAYHSERDIANDGRPRASIILMTPDGVELDDLSADVVDERDPAYLDDGRIVIKTTRASPWPKFRIAALRESGTAFDILTEALGGTDHRPSAKDPWIYYERFRSEGYFATDPGIRTKPWDLLSVHTLGGQGSTLVADGWANRSPIPDPTGAYVAHLRQSGHSAIELVTWTGTYLGRLVPNVTDVVQFDWK